MWERRHGMNVEPGDVIKVPAGDRGRDRRIGRIVRVTGEPGHERMVVRWDDDHESLFIPAGDVRVVHRGGGEFHLRRGSHAQTWEPLGG
jgi:hypothetical protein